ncbi:MAG: hypothetical protein J7M30_09295 [Deltaproteobacteria bacterium]|nr:hypothetical protein [Deltaproteobacteria bacterium]
MKNIDKILITCPECGAACPDTAAPLGSSGYLITCKTCWSQSVISDEDIAKAKADGRKSLSGKPLGSGAAKSEEESPLVRNARMRAEREV